MSAFEVGTTEPDPASFQEGEPWGPGLADDMARRGRELTLETAGRVGAMLLNENRRSVDHRYAESELEAPYLFRQLGGTPDPIVTLKARSSRPPKTTYVTA